MSSFKGFRVPGIGFKIFLFKVLRVEGSAYSFTDSSN